MLVRMPCLAKSDNVAVILVRMFVLWIAHATKGRLDIVRRSIESFRSHLMTDVNLQSSIQIFAG